MRRRRQLLPTLAILAGAGLLLAGVYHEVPAWLGMTGVAVLLAGGLWGMRRTGTERREGAPMYWTSADTASPTFGDFSSGHHHHHDGGSFDGGGGFDAGGGGFGGGGDGGGGGG